MADIDIKPDTNKPNEGMISVLVVEPSQGVNEDSDQVAFNEDSSEATLNDFEQKLL
jgi:hypothetical protein